jgi:hypothetical protein
MGNDPKTRNGGLSRRFLLAAGHEDLDTTDERIID